MWKPIAHTMKGGIVQAMKPTTKIFKAMAPVSWASRLAPALTPTIADEHHEAEILQDVARRIGCVAEEPQPRDDRGYDDAREQQTAGIAQADLRAESRKLDQSDQEAKDHAGRERQQVRRRIGASDSTKLGADLLDRGFEAHNREDVHALQGRS